ncbi:TPA: hypothetical protein ACPVZG_004129 [Vibrio parahaemolyticus]
MKASNKIALITFREDKSIITASDIILADSKEVGEQQIRGIMQNMANDPETDSYLIAANRGESIQSSIIQDEKEIEADVRCITRMAYYG